MIAYNRKKIFACRLSLCNEERFAKLKQTLLSSMACLVEGFRIGC